MEELAFLVVMIGAWGIMIALDIWLVFLNKKMRAGWERLRDQTQKDQKEVELQIVKNIEILNEIHRTGQANQKAQGSIHIQNQNFIRAHRKLFEKMSYDDFSDFLDDCTQEYLVEAIPYFQGAGLDDKVQIMKIYLQKNWRS